jgi:hypothetical protein
MGTENHTVDETTTVNASPTTPRPEPLNDNSTSSFDESGYKERDELLVPEVRTEFLGDIDIIFVWLR